jgi:hypothetical protein
MPVTVTFFQIGARVHLGPEAGHGDIDGELIGIGRLYLAIKLDDDRVDRRVRPSWVRRTGSNSYSKMVARYRQDLLAVHAAWPATVKA